MMYLVTGMPGNGKTLYAVDWLVRQIEADVELVKLKGTAPREFYTDIEGFDFNAVERLTGRRVMPAPEDWRETPQGSVIVYDEAHRRFPSTGKPGRAEDERIREMDTHRHFGYDLMFITQWPSKIHHEMRSLMGEHVHLHRALGLESAGLFRWGRVQIDPYDERQRETAEEEIWRFPKQRYPLYKSSTLHTASHKFRVPKKVWGALSMLTMGLVVAWGAWHFFLRDMHQASKKATAQEQAPLGALAPPPPQAVGSGDVVLNPGMGAASALNTMATPTLAGVAASERGCRAFHTEGFQIDMSEQECRRLLDSPLPFNVYHEFKPPAGNQQASNGSGRGSVAVTLPGSVTSVGESANVVTAPESHF